MWKPPLVVFPGNFAKASLGPCGLPNPGSAPAENLSTMKLLFVNELLGSQSPLATIFSKRGLHCKGSEIHPPLDRNSVDLARTRLWTRKCSLRNAGAAPEQLEELSHEELHTVVPR